MPRRLEHLQQVPAALCVGLVGGRGGVGGDGQHRALDGAHDPGSSRALPSARATAASWAPTTRQGSERARDAAEDLAEDDARVAPGPHERPARDRPAGGAHGVAVGRLEVQASRAFTTLSSVSAMFVPVSPSGTG